MRVNIYDEVILGAGWAGLLYANMKLTNYNYKIAIIEKETENEKGGLLRSETINRFTFDIGGPHLLFSKDINILTSIIKLLDNNVTKRERNNYVLYNNKLVPYPFENGVYVLDPEARVNFIKGIIEHMMFISENKEWKPRNFLEWITGFFGDYMANEYLIPYNKKIWKKPLENMAADWFLHREGYLFLI